MWTKGRTLKTSVTKRWTKEQVEFNDLIEGNMIFSDFTYEDQGKSRKLVCVMAENHPDFQANRQLILKAHELKRTLKDINRILDSGLDVCPDSPIHGHIKKLLSNFL